MREANVALESASRLAEELRHPAQMWDVTVARAGIALLEGRFTEAEELIPKAFELGRHVESSSVVDVRLQMFLLRREQGRLEDQEEMIADSIQKQPARPIFRAMLALVHSELGQERDARRAFDDLAADDFSVIPQDEEWLYSLSLLADAAWFLRDRDHAAKLFDLLLPHSHALAVNPPIVSTGAVARSLGVLAAIQNRWAEATRQFDSALAINAKAGARPWVAHTQHDHARMLLAHDEPGDRAQARELLSAASTSYLELGMESHAGRASVLLEGAT
jgi:tetratricopeptide (TPR) repeat protein